MSPSKNRPLELIALFALLAAQPALAEMDVQPKQVALKSKIVEVNDKQARELGVSYLLYQNLDGRDGKAEVVFVVTPQPDNKTRIEVTSIAYGRGADYRRVVPQNPILTVFPDVIGDGSIKMNLRPESVSKIYVDKPSAASPIAPILFGIIGSQYEGPGAEAASSPGKVCPVTGQPLAEGQGERGDVAQAIDKVGMAAGMALLSSQAKGQLEGQKAVFISGTPVAGLLFKTEAFNKDKKQLLIFVTPTILQVEEP